MQYRRDIDGLRALAVLPVILFHAGFPHFDGGFVGVDVFFVISGYLITTLIIGELEQGKFSLVTFYERRARRILPALFVIMLFCVPFAWLWLLPEDMKKFSQSMVAVAAFASNLLFWKTSNYFDTPTTLKPLLHTWSLGVEEQFYVLFPLLLLLMWRLGRRWILALLAAAAIVSLAASQWGSIADPSWTFYLLPTRGWELLLGAFLAFYFARHPRENLDPRFQQAGSVLGLVLLLASVFLLDEKTPFPSLYALLPTIGAALIILCSSENTWVGKLLGNQIVVGIGLISYSAYLWHQPLFAFARHRVLGEPSALLMVILTIVSLGLAYLSWKYIEAPFRNRQKVTRTQIFSFAAAGSLLFISVGLAGHFNKGFPSRMPASTEIADIALPTVDNGWCFYSIDTISRLDYGEHGLACWLGDKNSARKSILVGDSYAAQYEPFWDDIGARNHMAINAVTTNWCYPSINDEFTGPQSSRAFKQCLYDRKYVRENLSRYDIAIFGGCWQAVLAQEKMDGVLRLIELAATQNHLVVVMASPTQFDVNVMDMYKKTLLHGAVFDITKVPARGDAMARKANGMLEALARRYDNVVYIDRNSLFAGKGLQRDMTRNGVPFALDSGHISIHGSKSAAENFLNSGEYPVFQALVRKDSPLTARKN
jgi:peptidoglycan/LPS O-acetylase OafA/YrhL